MSSKEKTMFLCRLALLTAAYFVLSITLTIKTPYLEITFKSLPVVVGALMFGLSTVTLITFPKYCFPVCKASSCSSQWPPPSPSGAAIWRSGL